MQTMTISQFMNREYESGTFVNCLIAHLKKHKITYQVIGTTLIIFASGALDISVYASTGSGIDAGANRIYHKILGIGKWIIICKGAFDTLQNTLQGDFGAARKSFLQYLLAYILLLAFPFALNEVDKLFSEF